MTRHFSFNKILRLLFCLLFSLEMVPVVAQRDINKRTEIDSLRASFRRDSARIYGFKKIRPFVNYHERNSIENPKTINFFGPQFGMLLHERHITGLGIYFSTPNTKKPFNILDGNKEAIKRIDITYMTAFYQYILLQYRFFEFHLPVEIGFGTLNASYFNTSSELYRTSKNNFLISAASAQFIFKPLKWLGLSAIYGYRLAQEHIIDGTFYAVGVWIGLKPLLMDINYLKRKRKYHSELHRIQHGH